MRNRTMSPPSLSLTPFLSFPSVHAALKPMCEHSSRAGNAHKMVPKDVGMFSMQGASWHGADPTLYGARIISQFLKATDQCSSFGVGITDIRCFIHAMFSARGSHDEVF